MFPRVHVMFSSYALIFCDSFLLCYRNWSISEVYRLYSLDRKKVMAGIELNKKIARSWHSFPKQMMICLSQAKLLSKNHFFYMQCLQIDNQASSLKL